MEARNSQLAHLERLAQALDPAVFTAEIVSTIARPYVKVASASDPKLNERVHCVQADDGSWVFQWPWRQPIGSVDDLEAVAGKIAEVLRPVVGER